MNKLKKIWLENKILFILFIVLIICFIAICIVCTTFFFGGKTSSYGDRLDSILSYPITETIKNNYLNKLEDNENIKKVDMNISGKVVYVNVYFNQITLEKAKTLASDSLKYIDEDLLKRYDIIVYMESNDFNISGAKNKDSEEIVWNNNRVVEEDNEE